MGTRDGKSGANNLKVDTANSITAMLLKLGADTSVIAINKRNVAHIACTKKYGLRVLKLLHDWDKNEAEKSILDKIIEEKDIWGATPFDIAEYKGHNDQVKYRRAFFLC